MEPRQPAPGVVARLMGLDEFQPRQPAQKKPKVLSEKYMRRVSSIGARSKHQELRCSFGRISEESREYNILEGNKQNGKRKAHLNSEVSLGASSYRDVGVCKNAWNACDQRYSESHSSRDFGINDRSLTTLNDGLSSSTGRIVILKPHTWNLETMSSSSKRGTKRIGVVKNKMLAREVSGPRFLNDGIFQRKSGKDLAIPDHGLKKSATLSFNPGGYPSGSHVISGTNFKNRGPVSGENNQYGWKVRSIGRLQRPTPLHWNLSAIRSHAPSASHDSVVETSSRVSNREFINFVHEKARKLNCDQRDDSQRRISEKLYEEKSPSAEVLGVANKNPETSNGFPCVAENKFDKDSYSQSSYEMVVDGELKFVNGSPLALDEQQLLEMQNGDLSVKDQDDFSRTIDVSAHKEISTGTFEKESISSNCTCTDPESLLSSDDAYYQSSPNSVLEASYRKEISSCFDCWDGAAASLHGLHIRLELLKSETSDGNSEDFDTMVSSEGDPREEESVGDFEANEDSMRLFKAEESRDFSYLVDVLTEAGLINRSSHMIGPNYSCHPDECTIISPFVFETLEKKYGDQVSWKRADRRLLFDRINTALIEILQTSLSSWSKPVARRFMLSNGGQEDIEEEVWTLLASHENGSDKVMWQDDKWLELGDHVQDISRDIANSLLDELLEDAVTSMD